MSDTRWRVIGRGFAGWHAAAPNVRSSNGELLPYKYWTGKQCTGYLGEAKDGAWVYDAEQADGPAFSHFIIAGPMIGFGRECVKDWRNAGSFQFVTARHYFKLLKALVPGVRLGRVRNGAILWNA